MLLLALALATMPRQIGGMSDADMASFPAVLSSRKAAATRAELTVDESGRPVRCEITVSDGVPALDKEACRYLMRKARFTPAAGGDGVPLYAVVRLDFAVSQITPASRGQGNPPWKVDFALQVADLPQSSTTVVDALLVTDAAGKVATCDVARSSTVVQLDRLACRQLQATSFAPARDRGDRPVPAVRQVSVGFAATVPP